MEQLGTYSNVGTLVMLVALVVYKFLKHSSCKSRCLGQENSIKIDLSAPASETKLDEKLMSISPPSSPPSPRHSPRPRIYV
jgi:hypothetical protein